MAEEAGEAGPPPEESPKAFDQQSEKRRSSTTEVRVFFALSLSNPLIISPLCWFGLVTDVVSSQLYDLTRVHLAPLEYGS